MLSIALWTHSAGTALRGTLQALDPLRHQGDIELVLLDSGSQDDTLAELTQFAVGGGHLIRIDAAGADAAAVQALARAEAHHPYLMLLRPGDRVEAAAVPGLLGRLSGAAPASMIMHHTHWLGDPALRLPAPDAARVADLGDMPDPAALRQLSPDLRRVLVHRDTARALETEPAATGDPVLDWPLWDRLTGAGPVALYDIATVSLSPPPITGPAALRAAAAILSRTPDAPALIWAADALALADPDPECLDAAAALPPDPQAPDPLGPVLRAVHAGESGAALAHLALASARRDRQLSTALTAQVARLRADLDLALPGPAYLRALYDRIRAQ